jgi:STAG domain
MVSASDLGVLYSTQMMDTLQQWVVSMSSSQIRSFRHTATVIALEAETALCDVASAVEKEAVVVARQREGEKKRKGSKGGSVRNKELEKRAHEISKKQKRLASFIKEFVDGYASFLLIPMMLNCLTASSSTDIVTLIQIFGLNVFGLLVYGSGSTPSTFLRQITSFTLHGFYPTPTATFGWRP